MKYFLPIFALIAGCSSTPTTVSRIPSNSPNAGFSILQSVADGVVAKGRVQNGADLGTCQTRILQQPDGSILVEHFLEAQAKKVSMTIPNDAEVTEVNSSLLAYEPDNSQGVLVGHLNGKFFQVRVSFDRGMITCGSYRR